MAIASRRAETIWEGTLATGQGSVRGESGAIDALPVTWAARTREPGGKTSPEELAAAAHSACFAMALALRLGEHKARAERMSVAATVTLDEVDGVPTIVSSALEIAADVPGIDGERFETIVEEAAELCPVSPVVCGRRGLGPRRAAATVMARALPDRTPESQPVSARAREASGGRPSVDELGEWSFPASDPPQAWTWEVPRRAVGRADDDEQR